jgi:hypothetical protein
MRDLNKKVVPASEIDDGGLPDASAICSAVVKSIRPNAITIRCQRRILLVYRSLEKRWMQLATEDMEDAIDSILSVFVSFLL